MKACPGTICSYPCSSSSPGCLSFGCMDWASMLTAKVGRFMQSSLARRSVFIRTQFRTTDGFPPNSSGRFGWLWIREEVVEFFRKSGAVDEPTIQSETDRYIAWPAQALSYKLGQLKFRELRERSQKELGPKFDIRRFHDEMLDGGTLPLDLLDARTDKWIAEQKSK